MPERFEYNDDCPNCVWTRARPLALNVQGHTVVADYACTSCGHVWWTSWGAQNGEDRPDLEAS